MFGKVFNFFYSRARNPGMVGYLWTVGYLVVIASLVLFLMLAVPYLVSLIGPKVFLTLVVVALLLWLAKFMHKVAAGDD